MSLKLQRYNRKTRKIRDFNTPNLGVSKILIYGQKNWLNQENNLLKSLNIKRNQ